MMRRSGLSCAMVSAAIVCLLSVSFAEAAAPARGPALQARLRRPSPRN